MLMNAVSGCCLSAPVFFGEWVPGRGGDGFQYKGYYYKTMKIPNSLTVQC